MHAIGCVGGTRQGVLLQLRSALFSFGSERELLILMNHHCMQRCDTSPLIVVRRSPTPVHDDHTDRLAAEQRTPPGGVVLTQKRGGRQETCTNCIVQRVLAAPWRRGCKS
jgi:hypothetical protein